MGTFIYVLDLGFLSGVTKNRSGTGYVRFNLSLKNKKHV